jgi:hypothetical protein
MCKNFIFAKRVFQFLVVTNIFALLCISSGVKWPLLLGKSENNFMRSIRFETDSKWFQKQQKCKNWSMKSSA